MHGLSQYDPAEQPPIQEAWIDDGWTDLSEEPIPPLQPLLSLEFDLG